MFMQSLDSVSTFFFWSHKGTLWEKKTKEAGFSNMKLFISIEVWEITQTINDSHFLQHVLGYVWKLFHPTC